MKAYLARSGKTASEWSASAGLHKTTVSRAMKDDFNSVTSIPTLHRLASAAGIPSVLDFLRAQAVEQELPDLTIELLRETLAMLGCTLTDADFNWLSTVMLSARAMIDKLEPDMRSNPTFRKAVLKAVVEKANR